MITFEEFYKSKGATSFNLMQDKILLLDDQLKTISLIHIGYKNQNLCVVNEIGLLEGVENSEGEIHLPHVVENGFDGKNWLYFLFDAGTI